jgi:hypothetical protein
LDDEFFITPLLLMKRDKYAMSKVTPYAGANQEKGDAKHECESLLIP